MVSANVLLNFNQLETKKGQQMALQLPKSSSGPILTLMIIAANGRLSDWENFDTNRNQSYREKDPRKLATAIVAQLTHPEAVNCLANDWSRLPSDVRMHITDSCNREWHQPSSNNKTKMIRSLDERLGGKILSTESESERDRFRDASGRTYNEAAAAAQRKYAGFNNNALKRQKRGKK